MAALFGIGFDAGLFTLQGKTVNTDNYSNAALIYYVGGIAGAWPISLCLQKFPIRNVLSVLTMCWGISFGCTVRRSLLSDLLSRSGLFNGVHYPRLPVPPTPVRAPHFERSKSWADLPSSTIQQRSWPSVSYLASRVLASCRRKASWPPNGTRRVRALLQLGNLVQNSRLRAPVRLRRASAAI